MQTIDSLLQLEAGSAAKIASGDGTGVAINLRKHKASICRFHVTACDATDGSETYVLILAVSDLVGGTYTEVARVTVPRGVTGIYEVAVTGVGVEKLDADCDWARVSWTLGGATPSITFKAYIVPVV